MKNRLLSLFLFCLVYHSCNKIPSDGNVIKYNYFEPNYDSVQIVPANDTISFLLNDNTYNAINSFNVFSQQGVDYIAFYDNRSSSLNIYNFYSQVLVKKILMEKVFQGDELYKTTAYVKNFDSIFVTNKTTLYILDSTGALRKSINFLKKPAFAWAYFKNVNPPILTDSQMYVSVRPYADETSLGAIGKWKILYGFDLNKGEATLHYNYPKLYRENFYGYYFLDDSHCYNNKGRIVFSFPADSNIYETNLSDYHEAYYGKSQLQKDGIQPVERKELVKEGLKDNEGRRNYLTRNSYGAIYFDSCAKRYLRIIKLKISASEYAAKNWKRRQHIIIFNEKFRIIGESDMDMELSLSSVAITSSGDIYVRTNAVDENALHFVRLAYSDKRNTHIHLAQSCIGSEYK